MTTDERHVRCRACLAAIGLQPRSDAGMFSGVCLGCGGRGLVYDVKHVTEIRDEAAGGSRELRSRDGVVTAAVMVLGAIVTCLAVVWWSSRMGG